jgi:hypothetical protein
VARGRTVKTSSFLKDLIAEIGTITTAIDSPVALKYFYNATLFAVARMRDIINEGGYIAFFEVMFWKITI